MSSYLPQVIVLIGPTASGKTELAIEIAKYFKTRIHNIDSRQIYKFMDIGTAKPTEQQQQKIKHFLIDITKPNNPINVTNNGTRLALKDGDGTDANASFVITNVSGLYNFAGISIWLPVTNGYRVASCSRACISTLPPPVKFIFVTLNVCVLKFNTSELTLITSPGSTASSSGVAVKLINL